jgi:hypothetical protein
VPRAHEYVQWSRNPGHQFLDRRRIDDARHEDAVRARSPERFRPRMQALLEAEVHRRARRLAKPAARPSSTTSTRP